MLINMHTPQIHRQIHHLTLPVYLHIQLILHPPSFPLGLPVNLEAKVLWLWSLLVSPPGRAQAAQGRGWAWHTCPLIAEGRGGVTEKTHFVLYVPIIILLQ